MKAENVTQKGKYFRVVSVGKATMLLVVFARHETSGPNYGLHS